jgi:conjugal transfer mating pair stabilization protein TraG
MRGSLSSLSHSMISGIQNSTTSAASEAASASFSLGQTSFYNATGNTLSANKHDSNYTSMAGNTTRMLDSGATVTRNLDGTDVIDASGTVSRGTTTISSSNAISGMLNDAAEINTQAISSKSKQLSSLISEGISQLTQFSELTGKDARLGDGVSESDSAQMQRAVSNVLGIASTVAERTGTTTEQALTGIVSAGATGQVGVNSERSILGKAAGLLWGADGSLYARTSYEKSDSTAQRAQDGYEKVLDAKQMQDFRSDYSFMQNFSQNHHLDTSTSKGASLLSQASGDLRHAQNISESLDSNYSQAERIARAKSVTESGGATINQNMDQMYQEYVTEKVGTEQRNYLYGHPGDAQAQATLSSLANQFLSDEGIRNKIIDTYGNSNHQINPQARFQSDNHAIKSQEKELRSNYMSTKNNLQSQGESQGVRFNDEAAQSLQNRVQTSIQEQKKDTKTVQSELGAKTFIQTQDADSHMMKGRKKSHAKSIITGE